MESSQLYAAMSPVFWICRVSGLFPFSNNFKISIFWVIFPLALFGLVTANAYFFYFYAEEFEGFAGEMYFGLCFSLYVSVAALIVNSFSMGGIYKKIMATVLDVETFLTQLDVQFKYCTATIVLDVVLRAATIFATSIANYNQYRDDTLQLYLRAVGFYLTHWCVNCVEMQIVALCSYLSCLIKATTSSLPSPDFEGFIEASTSFVEISEMIHELFSKPTFVIFGNIFICTTLDLYFLIVVLPEMESRSIKWFSLGRCLARSYQLWRLVSTATSMSDEAKRLDSKLYTTAIEDPTNQLSKKKKLILYFSMKQRMEITACGFFPINYALIHSVVAAVTNYLVILVQFGNTPS